MSAEGWFRFAMEGMPEQVLDLKHAGIVLFGVAGAGSTMLSVNVDVWAAPRLVSWTDPRFPDDGEIEHNVAPAFYTEWLEMPRAVLAGRGLDAVDGLSFDYDVTDPDAPDESPGAINQDSHALFDRAKMTVSHRGDGYYAVQAEGVTEFGWTFALEATAPLEKIVFRHDDRARQGAPDPEVEAEFDTLFDRAPFDCGWRRRGSTEYGWHDFIATAKGQAE